MINNILKLKDKNISDIIKIGFVDIEDGFSHMNFADKYLFIEFDTFFLKLTSVEQYSQLQIEITSKISFDAELDDALIPAQASIATIVLTDDMADNRINSLEIYNCSDRQDQNILCEALSIYLTCGQELFIDPTYYFGLNIGGKEQKEKWLINLAVDSTKIISEIINF
jgi:hypothetical protein